MNKHPIVAVLSLCLMLFASISAAACTCDDPEIPNVRYFCAVDAHHHDQASGLDHAAWLQDHSTQLCSHDCVDATVIHAAQISISDGILASAPAFHPAVLSGPARIDWDLPRGNDPPRFDATLLPHLPRTPVALYNVMRI